MPTIKESAKKIFGKIDNLSAQTHWTTGVLNTFRWLTWDTHYVLGISKTAYQKKIITWVFEAQGQTLSKDLYETVKNYVDSELKKARTSPQLPYAAKGRGIAHPYELLRRALFFDEAYLNKEFDIFFALASDRYVTEFYQNLNLKIADGPGIWTTHAHGPLFEDTVDLPKKMQIDNVAYNEQKKVLVANELKLNAKKNADQILKYAYLFSQLKKKGFVDANTTFNLLFISPQKSMGDEIDLPLLIQKELLYCDPPPNTQENAATKERRTRLKHLVDKEVVDLAKSMTIKFTSWEDMVKFNNVYLDNKDLGQVEQKLLAGFNNTVSHKHLLIKGKKPESLEEQFIQ